MKRMILMLATVALLLGGVGQAKADLFNFTYTETDGLNSPPVTVVGSLVANSIGGGTYLATSGTATVTGDPSIVSTISLIPGGVSYGYPINYTPDNYLYPGGSLIDSAGLIFSDTSGDLINIYSLSGGTAYYVSNISPYPITSGLFGTFTLTAVPEPSGIVLLGLSVICLATGYVVRKKTLAPTAA